MVGYWKFILEEGMHFWRGEEEGTLICATGCSRKLVWNYGQILFTKMFLCPEGNGRHVKLIFYKVAYISCWFTDLLYFIHCYCDYCVVLLLTHWPTYLNTLCSVLSIFYRFNLKNNNVNLVAELSRIISSPAHRQFIIFWGLKIL